MALATFKLVTNRPVEFAGRNLPSGSAVLVLAAETEADVRWAFGRMGWSHYDLIRVEEPKHTDTSPAKGGKK